MLYHSRLPRVSDDRELGKKKTRKRQINMDSNSDRGGKRRKVAGEDEVSDRISELPESIAHHILNFLRCPKDVARITVLSKNWKRVFDSYQSFHFDHRWFQTQREVGIFERKRRREDWDSFEGFVTNALATRLDRLECVDKFRLLANGIDPFMQQPVQSMAEWIRAAIAKNVKELEVCAGTYHEMPIGLAESSSITFLKLTGSSLYGLASLKMCNLKGVLIREAVYLDAELVKRLEQNCPLLEDLRIVGCSHLHYLQISSLVKLKRVEVHDCPLTKRIEITAPNLETFWFHGQNNVKYKIRLNCTEKLRNLTLMGSGMTDSAFENHISMSPLLEKLELRNCTRIEKIRICSQTLKSLTLIKCYMLNEVDVFAPYLHSFEYQGHGRFFPLLNAPRVSHVKLSPSSCNKRPDDSCDRFSWDLDGSKAGLKLIIYTKKTMKIFEEAREKDLWQAKAGRIELIASASKVMKNVDNWLREIHGKSLDLVSSAEGELLEQGEKDEAGDGKEIVVGPWGGNGGSNWDDGCFNGVREIKLMYGRCIDSIRVVYDRNGRPVAAEKRGGSGGTKTAEVKLQFPEEYFTAVWGHYAPVVHGGSPVIRSLTFRTNRRTLGVFGVEEGTPFSLPMEGGQIVGFKGKCGWYVDAIGFHIAKVKTAKAVPRAQPSLFRRLTSSVSFAPLALRDGDEARARSTKPAPLTLRDGDEARARSTKPAPLTLRDGDEARARTAKPPT
ncbi:hypothetical protein SASPL_148295 [Salvia splendens]|uniref:Jacalin-type lectin domain-containing protein n=2 Tax=Salvia splendens TaxID=180675 RepID=A0A8X8Z480_SALSN|nr:hypothetical protein SASPL_148295 [Salvia splendens]